MVDDTRRVSSTPRGPLGVDAGTCRRPLGVCHGRGGRALTAATGAACRRVRHGLGRGRCAALARCCAVVVAGADHERLVQRHGADGVVHHDRDAGRDLGHRRPGRSRGHGHPRRLTGGTGGVRGHERCSGVPRWTPWNFSPRSVVQRRRSLDWRCRDHAGTLHPHAVPCAHMNRDRRLSRWPSAFLPRAFSSPRGRQRLTSTFAIADRDSRISLRDEGMSLRDSRISPRDSRISPRDVGMSPRDS